LEGLGGCIDEEKTVFYVWMTGEKRFCTGLKERPLNKECVRGDGKKYEGKRKDCGNTS